MKKYKLKKDLPMLEAGNEVILELKKINDKKVWFYYDIKSTNTNRVFDSFCVISKSKINEWLEEIKKPKSIWNLKEIDDYFYYIWKYWEIRETNMWTEEMSEYWNIFLTLEEAEKELEKIKAIQKIKKYCWENWIETDYKKIEDGKFCYLIAYDFLNDRLSIIRISEVNIFYSPIWYFSEENTEKILEKFEEELKIILDV